MNLRVFGVFHWILIAAVLTSLAAGAYLAQALLQQSRLIEHSYRQGSWGAVQVDSEILKLALALERYRRTDGGTDREALGLQRELYISRVLFLRDSAEAAQIRALPETAKDLASLVETVDAVDRGVQRMVEGDFKDADALAALVQKLRGNTRNMTQYLLLKDSALLSRQHLADLFERMLLCALLLLVAGGALFFLVLRQTGAAKASEAAAGIARVEASRQRERLESALDGSADPFVVSDRGGGVVFANSAYRSLVAGAAVSTAPGASLEALLRAEAGMLAEGSDDAKATKAGFLARSMAPDKPFLARLSDGRTLLYRAHSGPEGGLVLMRTDFTERTRLERERAEFRDQFHHAMKMEAIGRLAGGIAHDFNNVLTAILTFAEMLKADLAERPDQQRMADRIAGAAQRAAGLVKQILSFSRKDQASESEVDVSAVAKETLALLRATTPQTMLTSFSGGEGALVRADPGKISQVLMNLCVNARDAIGMRPGAIELAVKQPVFDRAAERLGAKHTPPAGAALVNIVSTADGRTHYVHVGTLAPDRPCVCICVRDNGGGIKRAVLERMFEPFFTTKEIGQGSGLGLAAVHGIVLGLEGTISVETTEGAGTTFRIYLPLPQVAKAA